MKTIKTIFLLLMALNYTAQTLITHDKDDLRLRWYRDSMVNYLCGLQQVKIALEIKDTNDLFECNLAFIKTERIRKLINPRILPVAFDRSHRFWFYEDQNRKTGWIPDLYQKPFIRVIYRSTPLKVGAKKKKLSKIKIQQPKKYWTVIFKINGKAVSKEQFEKAYTKEEVADVYKKLEKARK